jgi:GNAT superfamily N-acetyltransferase
LGRAAALKRDLEDRTYRTFGSPEEHAAGLAEFCSETYLRILHDDPETFLHVAASDGRLVGLGAITREMDSARVHAIYVYAPARGVGSSLLAALLTHVSTWGTANVTCEVMEGNVAARRFFERRGFAEFGQRPSDTYSGQMLIRMRAPADLLAVRTIPAASAVPQSA